MSRVGSWAEALRRELRLLKLLATDPRVPRRVRWIAGATAAYAISPIDLIPDFIPLLGQLDDLVIVPAGIWLALRMMPPDLLEQLRIEARADD